VTPPEGWEVVVGLEVHAELKTTTKMFCGCANAFGAEPNTNVCAVCLGLPGSLPVLNRRAVELAMAIGFALHSEVGFSTFHRKNYFYPDMPKNFQISQYDLPINSGGYLDLPDGTRVGIVRAHLEEDTGKTTHLGASGRIHGADRSLVDYNRAGVPLVEIVSEPDIRSSAQARAYVSELRGILIASGASDGRMEEGSLRVDANVSVHKVGEPYGTRCEIKNLNSLRSLQRAIDYEAQRQVGLLDSGKRVRQETRHWDEDSGATSTMRVKEEAEDYRYFREPDLVDLVPDAPWQERVRRSLGAMPAERRVALRERFASLSPSQQEALHTVVELGLDHYVISAANAAVEPSLALARASNTVASGIDHVQNLTDDSFASVLSREQRGELSPTQSVSVLLELLEHGGDPDQIVKDRGFGQLTKELVAETVATLITQHPEEWGRYRDGDDKLAQYFVGLVMAATNGKANGKAVIEELRARR